MARIIEESRYEYDAEFGRSIFWPALLECYCGEEVELSDGLDNTCSGCGCNYNMSGQLVLHSRDPRVDEPYWED